MFKLHVSHLVQDPISIWQ